MKLCNPAVVAGLLESHGLRPHRSLGQHFLVDANILEKILDAGEVGPEDTVLEIGAGLGALTQGLLERGARVTAVELDHGLYRILATLLGSNPGLTLLQIDALDLDPVNLPGLDQGRQAKCVSNLPYAVATPLLLSLLSEAGRWERLVFLVQKEVAARMEARPGTKEYGYLSVAVQLRARVETVARIPPTVFLPPPKVDSSLVRLSPLREGAFTQGEILGALNAARVAFGQRRKTILKVLATDPRAGLDRGSAVRLLSSMGIDGGRRGETFSVAEFIELGRMLPRPEGEVTHRGR
ncbi:MAG: ribosomal RNA small subunit methyltransferase A [Firmicutes bacterium]|nr:ribosomal RNA small subunit methyltransferase A [Bacillota bacterium]